MKTVVITQGLPASGKSTWAKEQLKKEPGRWKRINRDDLRAMLDDNQFSKTNEKFIVSSQKQLLEKALREGYDVILDNTHLVPRTVKDLHIVCESVGDVKVIHQPFNTTIGECLKRNKARGGKVPEKAILGMAKASKISKGRVLERLEKYYPPHFHTESFEQDKSKERAIVCDLDGTLADISWRNPYDASRCYKDKPNWPVINLVKAMYQSGRKIIFVSGRSDKFKPQTIQFIEKYVRVDFQTIPYSLFMRKEGDVRKDTVIKKEIFFNNIEPFNYVEFVVDDRPSVVRMWRYDLNICVMQVNDKEF